MPFRGVAGERDLDIDQRFAVYADTQSGHCRYRQPRQPRPNLVGDPKLGSGERSINRWSTANPAAGTFGNAGRNILIGPGLQTLDTARSRRFALPRGGNVQLRFEMFNLLDRANFLLPNRTVDSPQFGTIVGAAAARQGQLGLKIGW
jgi:hypothetical protein